MAVEQGVRWMAESVALNALTAMASLRCRNGLDGPTNRASLQGASQLAMHAEADRGDEGDEESGRKLDQVDTATDPGRTSQSTADPLLAATASIGQNGPRDAAAAARALERLPFLDRQFVDPASLKPGDLVRLLVAGRTPGQEVCIAPPRTRQWDLGDGRREARARWVLPDVWSRASGQSISKYQVSKA